MASKASVAQEQDKFYRRFLREHGFQQSRLDQFIHGQSPDIDLSSYRQALQMVVDPKTYADIKQAENTYLFSDFKHYIFREVTPNQAQAAFREAVGTFFCQETLAIKQAILADIAAPISQRGYLFTLLTPAEQEEVFHNPRIKMSDKRDFLRIASDALSSTRVSGTEAIVSSVSLLTLLGILASVFFGMISGIVVAGVTLGAGRLTLGAFFIHFAASRCMRIFALTHELRSRRKKIEQLNHGLEDVDAACKKAMLGEKLSDLEAMYARYPVYYQTAMKNKIEALDLRIHSLIKSRFSQCVDLTSMVLALVVVFFLPHTATIVLLATVALYASGKLLETISREGLTIPYVGLIRIQSPGFRTGMLIVGRLLQYPVRYLIIKPYQLVHNYMVGENMGQKKLPQAEGFENMAGSVKESGAALQFKPASTPGHVLFGGTVILSDIIDSVLHLSNYYDSVSRKDKLVQIVREALTYDHNCDKHMRSIHPEVFGDNPSIPDLRSALDSLTRYLDCLREKKALSDKTQVAMTKSKEDRDIKIEDVLALKEKLRSKAEEGCLVVYPRQDQHPEKQAIDHNDVKGRAVYYLTEDEVALLAWDADQYAQKSIHPLAKKIQVVLSKQGLKDQDNMEKRIKRPLKIRDEKRLATKLPKTRNRAQ